MVVDDRRDAVWLLKTLLVRAGHDVRTADDGASGLAVIRDFSPDVVISDLLLTDATNAYEIAHVPRESPKTAPSS